MSSTTLNLQLMIFVSNILFGIVGITAATICSLAIRTLDADHWTYCICGIVVGAVAFTVSFFGCYGAYRKLRGYMWTYTILLVVLLAIQLAILFTFNSKDFVKSAIDKVEKLWPDEFNGNGTIIEFENEYKCCGLHGYKDYTDAGFKIPNTCYRHNIKSTSVDGVLFQVGCLETAESIYGYASYVIKVTMGTLCGIEGIILITSCILAHRYRQRSEAFYIDDKGYNNNL